MTNLNVVKLPSIQRMICIECGAEANASCNCGKAYVHQRVVGLGTV